MVKFVEQGAAKGCFPGSHLTGNEDNSFALLNAVQKMGKGLSVIRAGEKERGI